MIQDRLSSVSTCRYNRNAVASRIKFLSLVGHQMTIVCRVSCLNSLRDERSSVDCRRVDRRFCKSVCSKLPDPVGTIVRNFHTNDITSDNVARTSPERTLCHSCWERLSRLRLAIVRKLPTISLDYSVRLLETYLETWELFYGKDF